MDFGEAPSKAGDDLQSRGAGVDALGTVGQRSGGGAVEPVGREYRLFSRLPLPAGGVCGEGGQAVGVIGRP